jgi:CHASE2 domain-containing sensor protein
MAGARRTRAVVVPYSRGKRLLLGAVYLLSISGLIVWEYRDRIEAIAPACETVDAESKPAAYSVVYKRVLGWASAETASHVSVVAIPLDLENIQSNVCEARKYEADLLRSIATEHPAVIVIDKFFGPTACTQVPEATRELVDVVRSMAVPVVVGESTNKVPECDETCLARKPQLDFGSANVRRGLTRLNVEAEKIPMVWKVLPDESRDAKAVAADSLSWAAVKAYDPNFAESSRLQGIVESDRHPYAHLSLRLPRQSSTDLLCVAGTPEMLKRWAVHCPGQEKRVNLVGKVVLIGSEDESDRWPVLSSHMWGFDIQASYIESLLSGNYLRALPVWVTFVLFAAFLFVAEGLPVFLEGYRPHWKKRRILARAFRRQRYEWVAFWTVFFIVASSVLALAVGYLPPLAVFGDIVLVVVTRVLFFATETTEEPFLHPHSKGHHGTHG